MPQLVPVAASKGHDGEVFSVEWNHINKRTIISGSFDKTIKLWEAEKLATGPVASF